jgi:hypothetical protein
MKGAEKQKAPQRAGPLETQMLAECWLFSFFYPGCKPPANQSREIYVTAAPERLSNGARRELAAL